MSSSSNSLIRRRRRLLGLLPALLLGWAGVGYAAPAAVLAGWRRWGSGEFRRFGFLVYEASLWSAGDDPLQPPLALELTYQRQIAGPLIVDASIEEIRQLGVADEARLAQWRVQIAGLFPDVGPGDRLLGVHLADGARFYFNERPLGAIDDAAFARAFFAIWLDQRTSAPALRAALLKRRAA